MPGDDETGFEHRDAAEAELGETLRATREAQDLSIEEIAAELRIEARLLRALEQQRFQELGAPVFAKGYLKQYANRLDLDYGDLLIQYYRLAEPHDVTIEPSKVIRLRDERQITVWVIAALTLLLIAVFLFIWLGDSFVISPPPVVSPPQGDVLSESAAVIDPAAALATPSTPRRDSEPPVGGAPQSSQVSPAPTLSSEPQAIDAPGDTTALAVERGADLPPSESILDSQTATSVTAAREPGSVQIVLDFAAESWTEISDARGERLYYGLARAATRAEIAGVPPISFLLGDADAVNLLVDGEPYAIPAGSRRGNTAIFTLDSSE